MVEVRNLKLPSGLFEAEREVAALTSDGFEVTGVYHMDATEDSAAETWMSFERVTEQAA